MKTITSAILVSTLLAPAAYAQSHSQGIETQGYVELSYNNASSDDDIALTGDFDVFVGPKALGLGVPIGFDFGLEGVKSADNGSAHALYAAVSYSIVGVGKVSIGAPRSAYDSVLTSKHARTFNFFASPNERFAFASTLSNAAIASENQSYGVRFDSDVRPVEVSASYNTVELGTADLDSFALAVSFKYGDLIYSAAYENVSVPGGNHDNYKLGGQADLGEYVFGASFASTNTISGGDFQALEGFFTYRPTAKIDITATLLHYSWTDQNSYGLSGKYTFWRNAYAEIAAIRPARADDVYQLNIGWDF